MSLKKGIQSDFQNVTDLFFYLGNGGSSYFNSAAGPYYGICSLGEGIGLLDVDPEKQLNWPLIVNPNTTNPAVKTVHRQVLHFVIISAPIDKRKSEFTDKPGKITGLAKRHRIGHLLPQRFTQRTVAKIAAADVFIHSGHDSDTAAKTNWRIGLMSLKSHPFFA